MRIGFWLLVLAVICIPIMLLCKPCFFRGEPAHEENEEIEFTNINNNNDQANNQIQRNSADVNGGTDDAMKKRHDEM